MKIIKIVLIALSLNFASEIDENGKIQTDIAIGSELLTALLIQNYNVTIEKRLANKLSIRGDVSYLNIDVPDEGNYAKYENINIKQSYSSVGLRFYPWRDFNHGIFISPEYRHYWMTGKGRKSGEEADGSGNRIAIYGGFKHTTGSGFYMEVFLGIGRTSLLIEGKGTNILYEVSEVGPAFNGGIGWAF